MYCLAGKSDKLVNLRLMVMTFLSQSEPSLSYPHKLEVEKTECGFGVIGLT